MEQEDEDGPIPDYHVWEKPPSAPANNEPSEDAPIDVAILPMNQGVIDCRLPSLDIDLTSVTVHHINAVKFEGNPYPVCRHRITTTELEF